jgi:hypothetical protein
VEPDSAFVSTWYIVNLKSSTRTRWLCKINNLGERQLRREQTDRQGLLPDIEERLTNCCTLCGYVGHNSLTCVEPVQVPCVS